MAILVTNDTKLCVSGITGREGTFHALNNRSYGTQRGLRRHARQGRPGRRGHPGVQHVPRRGRRDRRQHGDDLRAAALRRRLDPRGRGRRHQPVICITEGIPAHDELRVYNHLARNPNVRLVGPNCPGILSPGKANVGIIPASLLQRGQRRRRVALRHADLPDRQRAGPGAASATRASSASAATRSRARRFIDIIAEFEADPETELIVMAGEIGGSAEEEAAEYIAENVSKPVVAYIAGFTAPPGKTMGHAGAIVSGTRRHRQGQAGGARGQGRARRPHADRGRRDRGRDRRLADRTA